MRIRARIVSCCAREINRALRLDFGNILARLFFRLYSRSTHHARQVRAAPTSNALLFAPFGARRLFTMGIDRRSSIRIGLTNARHLSSLATIGVVGKKRFDDFLIFG